MEEEITNLGTGALPDPVDIRDYPAETQFGAVPVDFNQPIRLPEPVDFNQKVSDSCVGCGSRNLHWGIKAPNAKDFSRRDIFSRIALASGAYLRDGVKVIVDIGNQDQKECPDPSSPSRENMRLKSNLPDSAGADDREANYFVVKQNTIDAVAQAIRDFKGAIIGVNVSSAGWKDKTNPRPPKAGESYEGHCIYVFGYHMHSGQKCLIAKSSWCSGSHHEHHIKEEFFTSGHTFNAWCIIPKDEQFMTNSLLLKRVVGNKPDGTPIVEYGFFDPATAPDALISDMRRRGINPPLKPDGTLDWDKVEPLVNGAVTNIN